MKFNGSAKIWEAASKDRSRPVLNAVNLRIESAPDGSRVGWLEATDSFQLVRVKVDELARDDAAGLIDPEALKDAAKNARTTLGYCELDCSEASKTTSADGFRSWPRPEGHFPEADRLILRDENGQPTGAGEHEGGVVAFGIDAALLVKITKATGARRGVALTVGSPLRTIAVRPLNAPVECEAIVMPVSLS